MFTWRWWNPDRWRNCGGSPHLTCECDQIKMRDYMDRRVTPPKRVTLPTWGTPPPCKQALGSHTSPHVRESKTFLDQSGSHPFFWIPSLRHRRDLTLVNKVCAAAPRSLFWVPNVFNELPEVGAFRISFHPDWQIDSGFFKHEGVL